MARVVTVRKEDGTVVCERCVLADSWWLRLRGLLGRADLPADEGILLRPAGSIHMFFMRFAIDAVFLDRRQRVVRVRAGLRPWRVVPLVLRAHSVLELPAGTVADLTLERGEQLSIEP